MNKWYKTLTNIASQSDIVLPGIKEGYELFGTQTARETADAFLMNGARLAIVKDGARGAYASDGIHHAYVPCFVVSQVIDTVGCGDGFAAGVLSALLEGTSVNSALTRGCAIGAMQTQSASDNDALPTREQLQEFINTHERVNANNSQQQQFKY